MPTTNPTLTTKRLELNPFAMGDTSALHEFWTLPGVRKYLWDDEIISYATAEEVIASSQHDFATHGYGHWVVRLKNSDDLIGWCGLRQFDDPAKVEVLYGIVPTHWGQGLAVEATIAVLQYGFEVLGLEEIYAGTDPPNAASLRVVEKLGMRFEQRRTINGLEAIYFVMSQADFAAQRCSDSI